MGEKPIIRGKPHFVNGIRVRAVALWRRAPVALRINPDVVAGTHDKISTGRREDKFGIPWDEVHEEAERLEHAMSPVLEERMRAAIRSASRRSARSLDRPSFSNLCCSSS